MRVRCNSLHSINSQQCNLSRSRIEQQSTASESGNDYKRRHSGGGKISIKKSFFVVLFKYNTLDHPTMIFRSFCFELSL